MGVHAHSRNKGFDVNNTFANDPGLKDDCTTWRRPKQATWVKICATKTGAGFAGSMFIGSLTDL
jgi:hypothetical protein